MTLEKGAWLFAVLASWTVAGAMFVSGYEGYGWVSIAVGIAASVNLFGEPDDPE